MRLTPVMSVTSALVVGFETFGVAGTFEVAPPASRHVARVT
jgi:hypothetical protein